MNRSYIISSVGRRAQNRPADVAVVVSLLRDQISHHNAMQLRPLRNLLKNMEKDMASLEQAIETFQRNVMRAPADGRVDAGGATIVARGGGWNTGKFIVVSLNEQTLEAFDGAHRVFEYDCTTGERSHPTDPGVFHISRKYREYRSRTYDPQMSYAKFFSADGKAIHQASAVWLTSTLRTLGMDGIGSHGCVRLSEENARQLFDWTPEGTMVHIFRA